MAMAKRHQGGLHNKLHWMANADSYLLMKILELSAAQLRRAADLKEQLDAARVQLTAILGSESACDGSCASAAPVAAQGKKFHWTQTPEGKARLARLIRKSWRKRRA